MAASKKAPRSKLRYPRKPGQPSAERRLRVVVDLMVRQAWSPRMISHYAKLWKVAESVVHRTAAEASRAIKLHMEASQGDMRERILASIQLVTELAIKDKKLAPAIKALELQAKIHGVVAPEEHRHSFEGVTDEELALALQEPVAEDPVEH